MKKFILLSLTLCLMAAFSTFGAVTGVGKEPVLKSYKIVSHVVANYNFNVAVLEDVSPGLVLSHGFVLLSIPEINYSFSFKVDHSKRSIIYHWQRFSNSEKLPGINKNSLCSSRFIQRGQRPISV